MAPAGHVQRPPALHVHQRRRSWRREGAGARRRLVRRDAGGREVGRARRLIPTSRFDLISSPSASSGRPAQRMRPGVFERWAMRPCIGTPSTSTIASRRQVVRVGGDVGHRHHRRDGGLGPLERGEHLAEGRRGDPVAHDTVELVAVLDCGRRTWRTAGRRRGRRAPSPGARPTRPTSRSRPTGRRRSGRCRGAPSTGCPSRAGAARSRAVGARR